MKSSCDGITAGSLFSGVGGFEKAIDVNWLWANELDRHAQKTFMANHSTYLIQGDIKNIVMLPEVDLLVAGFPCQPFSVAGKQAGFEDTRGTLFFDMLRIIQMTNPSILLLENVANIASHDKGNTLDVIMRSIHGLGYYTHTAILNTSTHANIPQNRRRWFLVAFKDDRSFSFPEPVKLTVGLADVLEKSVDDEYYYTDRYKIYPELAKQEWKQDTCYQWRRHYLRENKTGVCPTLTANMGVGGHNVPMIHDDKGIRKLTPIECFRLQGYDDIVLPVSNTQAYKQAGNMVTVPLIKRIWEQIRKTSYGSNTI